jgi:hypothetical protein
MQVSGIWERGHRGHGSGANSCDWTWKPTATTLRRPLSNSALLRLLRSRTTCKNAGLHSGKRVIAG